MAQLHDTAGAGAPRAPARRPMRPLLALMFLSAGDVCCEIERMQRQIGVKVL